MASSTASKNKVTATDSTTTPSAGSAARRTSPKTKYLITYNGLSCGLWLLVLVRTLQHAYPLAPRELYASTGTYVRWTQTLAVLEILHAALGLVRSGVATTALQVASRITLIWWIVEWFPVQGVPAYVSMLGAWSLTEVVRYAYFVVALTGEVPPFLIWLRYNLFFVLYPMGIGSEAFLVYSSIPAASKQNPLLGYALWAILGIYVPGSYILYTHMMAQRRRVLRGKQRAKN